MVRAKSTARTRAKWTASFIMLGAGTLPAAGAHAQNADTLAATDPNTITGLQLRFGLGAQEILTDNANGAASGSTFTNANGTTTTAPGGKRADLITSINPSVSVFDVTRSHSAGLIYSPSYQTYLNESNLDRLDNTLFTSGHTSAWDDRFTFDTSSSISRQIISQQGAVTTNGISSNINQTTVQTYTVTPAFQQRFGDFAVGQLVDLFGYTSSGALAPATQNQASASLVSGTDFNNFQWSLGVSDAESNQGSTPNANQQVNNVLNPTTTGRLSDRVGQVGLIYAVNRAVSLLTGVGYEKITDTSNSLNNTSGPFGSFGVGLTGSKLNLNIIYNLRYGGQFVSTQGTYNITEQLQAQVQYGESVTTQQNLQIAGTANSGFSPTGVPITKSTNQQFNPGGNLPGGANSGAGNVAIRDKAGQFLLTGNYDRNTWSFTVQTDDQSTDTTNFNQNTVTLIGSYSRDLRPDTHFNVNLGYLRIVASSPTSSTDNTYNASTGVSWDLGQDLTASATLAFLYRQSSLSGQNVTANSLTLGIQKNF